MANKYGENYAAVYQSYPTQMAKKGEIAGKVHCMIDRYTMGTESIGDVIFVGGKLPPNCTILSASMKTSAPIGTGVTLALRLAATRLEATSEASPGALIAEGTTSDLLPAKAWDAAGTNFNSTGILAVGVASPMIMKRLGKPDNDTGTDIKVITAGGANATVAVLEVCILYVSD
jgi:hypothetical protein